jgi:2-keto-4-pentenoate hydratase/2-oxohepta-3-ene-1,7-dioic acid hydratase in catechol pathway
MRLVTYEARGTARAEGRVGALVGDDLVVDLTRARAAELAARGHPRALREAEATVPSDALELLRGGEPALQAARDALDHVVAGGVSTLGDERVTFAPADVRLLSPLPRPNSLRDFMVVEEHVLRSYERAGNGAKVPEEWFNIPVYYKGNVDEVYGPDDVVPWPGYTDKLDYELEVGAVVGKAGRGIAAEDAHEHIVGYTLYNDWSARDIQFREMSVGIGPGYGKDFASSFGPCIATPDEFDRDNARLEARVDGEVWSSGVLGKMHFSFEQIVEWISQEQTIRPGDVLGSGTIGGGCGLELDRWLTEGCTVELSAEGIGVLRNRVGLKGQGTTNPDAVASERSER